MRTMAKMPHSGEYAEILRSLQRQLKAAELEIANQKWLINELLKSPSWRLTYRHSFRTRSGWRLHAPPHQPFKGESTLIQSSVTLPSTMWVTLQKELGHRWNPRGIKPKMSNYPLRSAQGKKHLNSLRLTSGYLSEQYCR